jgi:hypothetical protein
MTVKHQSLGGVDIYVLDTYTGEMRVQPNTIASTPVTLFKPDRLEGQRRFEELVAKLFWGGVDIYVLDTFTGEIRIRRRAEAEKSMRFFDRAEAGEYRRYSCCVYYNTGKLDFFVTDMVTGETRTELGVLSSDKVSLFSPADRRVKGCPRFLCWIEENSGHVDFYSLDMVSGSLRRHALTGGESLIPEIGRASNLGCNRFNGWVEYNAGNIDFYAQDGFSSEIRVFPAMQDKKELQLFDLPVDERSWQRFHSWILFNPGQAEIYTFDASAGAMKVDKLPAIGTSFRPVPEPSPQPAASARYQAERVLRRQNPGIELYVIDTYTSEIRIAKDVFEAKTYSLFADDSSHR